MLDTSNARLVRSSWFRPPITIQPGDVIATCRPCAWLAPFGVMSLALWGLWAVALCAPVIGWINKPAATIARRRVGKGGLVVTTFRLTNDAPGTDPVAAALFDGLVTTTANLEVD